MPKRILLLYAHPAADRSRANRVLLEAARAVDGVTVRDLYSVYPDLFVKASYEQKLIQEHDALVFQHPFYWYAAPALLKEWLDVVLTHKFAYGEGASALEAKPWLQAVTTGGAEFAYTPSGHNRFSVEELLRPFEASAALCRADWQRPFVVHGSRSLGEAALADAAHRYAGRLHALANPARAFEDATP